jgi:hypothetical protein
MTGHDYSEPSASLRRRLGLPDPIDLAPLVARSIAAQEAAVSAWLAKLDPPPDPATTCLAKYPGGDGRWDGMDVCYILMPSDLVPEVGGYGLTREQACGRYPWFRYKVEVVASGENADTAQRET